MKRVFKIDNNGPLKRREGFLKEKKTPWLLARVRHALMSFNFFSFVLQNCSAGFAASLPFDTPRFDNIQIHKSVPREPLI